MRYLIITKCDSEVKQLDTQDRESANELPNESIANVIMQNKSFIEYVHKHGYHFNDSLSIYASSLMDNKNGINHSWTPQQVRNVLIENGLTDYNSSTLGDITYLANMAYADFYPDILDSELQCIKYAYAVIHDVDGYEGIAFCRWIADIIGKHITDTQWNNY